MGDELRHCVYCRDAGRECEVICAESDDGEQVCCLVCGACGPTAATEEEAASLWNDNTELVATTVENAGHIGTLIELTETWEQRGAASMEFVTGVAALLKKFTDAAKEAADV